MRAGATLSPRGPGLCWRAAGASAVGHGQVPWPGSTQAYCGIPSHASSCIPVPVLKPVREPSRVDKDSGGPSGYTSALTWRTAASARGRQKAGGIASALGGIMRAAVVHRYGRADAVRLTRTNVPRPRSNEMLVRVLRSSINPSARASTVRPE